MRELDIPVIGGETRKTDFAELMRQVHSSVAFSPDGDIAGGNAYKVTHAAFLAAIAIAYPDQLATDIYEIWVDNGETVKYCVEWIKTNKRDMARMQVIESIEDMQDISRVYDGSENGVD